MCHQVRISVHPLEWTRASASRVNPLPQCTTLAVGYWEEPRPTLSHTPTPSRWRTLELIRYTSSSWSSYHSALMTGSRWIDLSLSLSQPRKWALIIQLYSMLHRLQFKSLTWRRLMLHVLFHVVMLCSMIATMWSGMWRWNQGRSFSWNSSTLWSTLHRMRWRDCWSKLVLKMQTIVIIVICYS